jgi:predicted AAA+ superfamily ATPase
MKQIERQELDSLNEWSSDIRRKALVIRGARQVGKSTLVRLFAESSNLDLVELNVERNPEYLLAFESYDPRKIIQNLELMLQSKNIQPGRTLLFLDEVQRSTKVIQSLRYFFEELPELHVIAAGSLLEFTLKDDNFSMPVGRIQYMHLGPLKFSDYLLAVGEDNLANYLRTASLKAYFLVGGMPEAAAVFAETQSFQKVSTIHQSILSTYRDDFGKYNTRLDKTKIQLAFDALPSLVGKQLKYSQISRAYKSSQIAGAVNLLIQARLVHKIKRTNANGIPLGAEPSAKPFKTIFADVGLVVSKLGLRFDGNDNSNLVVVNEGALAEQFVGQHLAYMPEYFREPELFYWAREVKGKSSELDYVINHNAKVIPIEVKSGKSGTLKSLHFFLAKKGLNFGVQLNTNKASLLETESNLTTGAKLSYTLLSLPLYLAEQLNRILDEAL